MPTPWTLDTMQFVVTVKHADESLHDLALAFRASLTDPDAVGIVAVRVVPTWMTVADEDRVHHDQKTGETRLITKGSPMSYEDIPTHVECVKPEQLVEDERA